jgi:hypothetical protein
MPSFQSPIILHATRFVFPHTTDSQSITGLSKSNCPGERYFIDRPISINQSRRKKPSACILMFVIGQVTLLIRFPAQVLGKWQNARAAGKSKVGWW